MKFKVAIEETVVGIFDIEADTAEEAMEKAERMYYDGEIVNEPGGGIGQEYGSSRANR